MWAGSGERPEVAENPLQYIDHRYFSQTLDVWPLICQPLMVLCCCCTHSHGLGSAVQTCPLLIHGAAAGLPGQNRAAGQVVMNGLPSASLSSLCPVLLGGPLGLAVGHMLVIGPHCLWPLVDVQRCCRKGQKKGLIVGFNLYRCYW